MATRPRRQRIETDVDRYVMTYGGMTSMLLWVLDSGCPAFTRDLPRELLPELVERYGGQLRPDGWAFRQVEDDDE